MPLFSRFLKNTPVLRRLCNISTNNQYLSINENVSEKKIPYFWLRDHCRCNKCYSKITNQTLFNIVDIPLDISLKTISKSDDNLKITWNDGHVSEYSINWIKNVKFGKQFDLNRVVHWNAEQFKKLENTSVNYDIYMNSSEGVKSLLKSVVNYGFGIVDNVPTTVKATEDVIKKVGAIKFTLFGGMWEVTNDGAHSDTAYSQISLLPHTDNTYFHDSAGIQVFHLLSHKGSGGETLLVDGFNACERLKINNPDAFHILSTTPIISRYLEDGYHYSTTDCVIKLNPINKQLHQIRYNIFDREVLENIPYENIMDFYQAYIKLGHILFSNTATVKLKLQPGSVIFIDNWRVLHGRLAYTGLRKLCGCYISRDDWTSKARTFKLNSN